MGYVRGFNPRPFYHRIGSGQSIPRNHIVRKIKDAIDFDFTYAEVKDGRGKKEPNLRFALLNLFDERIVYRVTNSNLLASKRKKGNEPQDVERQFIETMERLRIEKRYSPADQNWIDQLGRKHQPNANQACLTDSFHFQYYLSAKSQFLPV